jgi:hypothetical protein
MSAFPPAVTPELLKPTAHAKKAPVARSTSPVPARNRATKANRFPMEAMYPPILNAEPPAGTICLTSGLQTELLNSTAKPVLVQLTPAPRRRFTRRSPLQRNAD